ncbi:MAG: hypothetical protein DMG03_05390, partial [Acidobacteria bacterium]
MTGLGAAAAAYVFHDRVAQLSVGRLSTSNQQPTTSKTLVKLRRPLTEPGTRCSPSIATPMTSKQLTGVLHHLHSRSRDVDQLISLLRFHDAVEFEPDYVMHADSRPKPRQPIRSSALPGHAGHSRAVGVGRHARIARERRGVIDNRHRLHTRGSRRERLEGGHCVHGDDR